MEGQQPDSGDLSDESPVQAVDDAADETLDDAAVAAPVGPKRPARNRKALAVAASAGLFVAAGAFAGATAAPYLMDRATVATKLTIARTAADAITTLWSYTPDNMDTLADRSSVYLGGDFGSQYRKYVDAIAATNKQAKVTSETKVVGAAVESLRGNEATALVYTNTTSTSPQSNNIPSMKYLSYRLEMRREGRDWRVTKMTTITSLDLAPKL